MSKNNTGSYYITVCALAIIVIGKDLEFVM